ncbi:MAG: DUF5615 family PIN-like protein [Cyanobacteriota bacterium]|nr:DUF5615 family PIN-like protein [Cyanobacteriota bacterium]
MTIALYMDENVAGQITEGLRRRDVDVLTVQEDGLSGEPDPIVFDRATELQRVLFTQDDDFLAEGNSRQVEGVSFYGVIYAHQKRLSIGKCVQDLEIIAKACFPEEFADRVTYLPL